MKNCPLAGAMLLMAGVGRRLNSSTPKQFLKIDGQPIYRYALKALVDSHLFQEIVLVVHPDWIDQVQEDVTIVCGGQTRQESSFLGLQAFQKKIDIVLIHDAARPFVSQKILKENVLKAAIFGAVNTCIASTDTLVYSPDKKTIHSIPQRAQFLRGQTPQTFKMDWILEAHKQALHNKINNATDDCQLILSQNRPIHIVMGDENNFKITTELDFCLAKSVKRVSTKSTETDFVDTLLN